jgi:hypothetical protein
MCSMVPSSFLSFFALNRILDEECLKLRGGKNAESLNHGEQNALVLKQWQEGGWEREGCSGMGKPATQLYINRTHTSLVPHLIVHRLCLRL